MKLETPPQPRVELSGQDERQILVITLPGDTLSKEQIASYRNQPWLAEFHSSTASRLVINLTGITKVDGTGTGWIWKLHETFQQNCPTIPRPTALVIDQRARQVRQAASLALSIFPVFSSLKEALAALEQE